MRAAQYNTESPSKKGFDSIGLLVAAAQEKRSQGQMGERLAKYIYRTPRISGVLIILFVGMFALDVFSVGPSLWEMLGAFLIHAMPAILIADILALALDRVRGIFRRGPLFSAFCDPRPDRELWNSAAFFRPAGGYRPVVLGQLEVAYPGFTR